MRCSALEYNVDNNISFQRILGFAPDNRKIFDEIYSLVKNKAIVPFVGAGMSSPIYPLWGKALLAIAEKLFNPDSVAKCRKYISNGEYENAAQLLEDIRTPEYLGPDYSELFSPSKIHDQQSQIHQMAIWLIPQLFSGLAVTTNIDRMLEYVYKEYNRPFSNVLLPGERPELLEKYLRQPNAHCLYKFHGTVEADGNLDYGMTVFSKNQYDIHYRETSQLTRILREFYQKKPLLFLGCGLKQDRTLNVLKSVFQPGMTNYAIVPCDSSQREETITYLGSLGIRAILYPNGKFESVRIIMEQLLAMVKPQEFQQLQHHLGNTVIRTKKKMYSNRFQYNSGLFDTIGRKTELKELSEFIKDDEDFLWWAIVGPGGIGKSRLAFALSNHLPEGWAVKWVNKYDYSDSNSLLSPSQNTLFIADYVQLYISNIGHWISSQAKSYHNTKIRILLIERNAGDWEVRLRKSIKGNCSAIDAEYKREKGFLKLATIKDGELIELMGKYADAVLRISNGYKNKALSEPVLETLLSKLKRTDPGMCRPIYALFLTDAWLMGDNPIDSCPETLLGTILDREEHLIEERGKTILGDTADRLTSYTLDVWRLATVLQGMSEETLATIRSDIWSYLDQKAKEHDFNSVMGLLAAIGLINDNGQVSAVQPDLLGEYFILRWIGQNADGYQLALFFRNIWNYPLETTTFLDRVIVDYTDLLDRNPSWWGKLLSSKGIPQKYSYFYIMLLENASFYTNANNVISSLAVELEERSKGWKNDYEIGKLFANGLVCQAYQLDSNEAIKATRKLETLYNHYNDSVFASYYAKGLLNLSTKQSISDTINTVEQLKKLSNTWPDNLEISVRYAKGLVNLSEKQPESEAFATLLHIESLHHKWEDHIGIALVYAYGLFNLGIRQSEEALFDTIGQLDKIFYVWADVPNNLVVLSTIFLRRYTVKEIQSFRSNIENLMNKTTKYLKTLSDCRMILGSKTTRPQLKDISIGEARADNLIDRLSETASCVSLFDRELYNVNGIVFSGINIDCGLYHTCPTIFHESYQLLLDYYNRVFGEDYDRQNHS